jgi:molybdopterin converting factor subunit 1
VTVRLFALAKEKAGRSELAIELAHGATVADLRTALADRLPALAPLMPSVLIAVDEEYASDGTLISPGSRLAVIPPVSGGACDRTSAGRESQSAEDCSRNG